jgi:WD40 repeat protein
MNAKLHIKPIRILKGHRQGLYGLCTGANGTLLSCGGDGMLVAWQPLIEDDGKLIATVPEPVYSLAHDSRVGILCGGQSGSLYVITEGGETRNFQKHQQGIFWIGFLENGNFITCGGDGWAVLWNSQAEILQERKLSGRSLRCAVRIPNGWAFGSSDSDIYITDSEFRTQQILKGHKESVFALANAGGRLFSGGRDALIHIWDVAEGRQALPVNAHWYHVNDLKLSPSGKYLASASMDKTIKLWDPETMELLKVMDAAKYGAHASSVNRLLWINDTVLASASDDREIGIWEISES